MIGKSIIKPISKPVSWPIESGLDLGPILPFGSPYFDYDIREQLGPDAFRLHNVSNGTNISGAGWNISGVAGDIIRVRAYFQVLSEDSTPQWRLRKGELQSGQNTGRSNGVVNNSGTGWVDMTFTATGSYKSLTIVEASSDSDCRFLSVHISKS